jgi:hypothetical protein
LSIGGRGPAGLAGPPDLAEPLLYDLVAVRQR